MPAPKVAAKDQIAAIPQHVAALPPESASPIEHYRRGANDAVNLVRYFHRNMERTNVYPVPLARHAGRLHAMALLTLVETFERFLKELAAVGASEHLWTLPMAAFGASASWIAKSSRCRRQMRPHDHGSTAGSTSGLASRGPTWRRVCGDRRVFGVSPSGPT
jgi:hypothetical protein